MTKEELQDLAEDPVWGMLFWNYDGVWELTSCNPKEEYLNLAMIHHPYLNIKVTKENCSTFYNSPNNPEIVHAVECMKREILAEIKDRLGNF